MPLHEVHKKRKGRNLALAVVLIIMVGLFYWLTIAKMGASIMDRAL